MGKKLKLLWILTSKHFFEVQVRHLREQPEMSSRNNSIKVEVESAQ
jgi:hypothetical protein